MKTSGSGNCLLTKDNGATGTKKGKKQQLIDIQGWSAVFGLKNNKNPSCNSHSYTKVTTVL